MTKFNFPSFPSFITSNSPEKPAVRIEAETPAVIRYTDSVLDYTDSMIDVALSGDPGYDMPTAQTETIKEASKGIYIVREQDLRQASANLIEQAQQDEANQELNQTQVRAFIDSLYDEMKG